ncbi:MAG: hypothetical protein MUP21_11165 [Dehalococcoidia bacterium]|nr:hypothetical protein [Dehalococcoidia bacterium]
MRLMGGRFVDDEVYETYVLLGVRLILRDRRAKSIMEEMKEDDPAAYGLIMADAWRRYASLPDELRADRRKGIASLIKEGEKLQLGMIEKAREAGVFNLPE